jgi:hypothetical protein
LIIIPSVIYYELGAYTGIYFMQACLQFLLSYDPNDNSSIEPERVHKQVRRCYVTAGGVIETEREFKPSFLLRYEAGKI